MNWNQAADEIMQTSPSAWERIARQHASTHDDFWALSGALLRWANRPGIITARIQVALDASAMCKRICNEMYQRELDGMTEPQF